MVDIILLLMAIASAISLLVVRPRDLQRNAILALKEYDEMNSRTPMLVANMEQSRETPSHSRSGSHPLADV